MVTITPEMAGTGLIGSFVAIVVALVFQLYMLWLNWKQSKVKDKTERMIELLLEIREVLKVIAKKKK